MACLYISQNSHTNTSCKQMRISVYGNDMNEYIGIAEGYRPSSALPKIATDQEKTTPILEFFCT